MSSGTTKGSWHRPHDHQKYADNFDAIFRKNKEEKEKPVESVETPCPNPSTSVLTSSSSDT